EDSIRIFMANTSKSQFNTNSDWIANSEYTEVYYGPITLPDSTGWVKIILNHPFQLIPNMNLAIAVSENNTNDPIVPTGNHFYALGTSTNRSIKLVNNPGNSSPIDIDNIYSYTGIMESNIPNTILNFENNLPL